ncbi:Putative uncharacterized protein [Taphrina deformans PYCC 5710]|uniref:Transmembrane 9 superfamily member n=1 Tax=Taphrina deformans (strain PYCC 5710 / ATCC 11124 / CBS 356.35 / IMI 108563 / JCM 9778 / NBRC 8474) TaxID=1097556 RepID=R4X9M1_TAPDE|nr:Putative uncharacterized protein [Taphrina deformans PYCC 5710]|eukprot:CCG82425.1 Putative uncharacterized protein [Taphrina deformans PYCC 5710]
MKVRKDSPLAKLVCTLLFVRGTLSLSLDPFSPNVYWPGDKVPLSVNKLVSNAHDKTYNFYDLPFVCQPEEGITQSALSMDEVLRGDRIYHSDFKLEMLENEACHVLCTKELDAEAIQKANDLIRKDYKVEWYIDGLPGATSFSTHDKGHKYYASGFRLGTVGDDRHTYLNNHFTFVVKYRHSDNHDATRVVLAFEVYPRSIAMTENDWRSMNRKYPGSCEIDALETVETAPGVPLAYSDTSLHQNLTITYTYSVYFREDLDIHWTDRWNMYFYYSNTRIVWYSTALSAIICILLTSVVGVILARTLSTEISSISRSIKNDLDLNEDDIAGWKRLRAEITRPPQRPDLLCALLCNGMQIIISILALLIRTKISSSIGVFGLFFAGVLSGFYAGSKYKSFDREDWQRQSVLMSIQVPSFFFSILLVLNFFLWLQGASAIPISTLFELLGLWFAGSVPLVLIGAYTGARKPTNEHIQRANPVARSVPRQPIFTRFWPSLLIAGALPYAAICVELYFILQAFKLHENGYLSFIFKSLTLVIFIAIITTVEVTVTMIYLQLNHEDHRWHWRAFLYGSASAGYIFAHATFYFITTLQYGFISGIVYFGYTVLFCLLYALIQGMLGYVASSIFVAKIYSSIKVD